MAKKVTNTSNYPMGVLVSDEPCKGPVNNRDKYGKGTCPKGNMLKQKIHDAGGTQCFSCFEGDQEWMNKGKGHGGIYQGSTGMPGSKGGPRKRGSGVPKKAMSAGK